LVINESIIMNYFSKVLFVSVSYCFLLVPVWGQTLEIEDSSVEYKDERHASLKAEIDPDPKAIKKAWQDYLKENHDVKIKGIGFLVNKDVLKGEQVSFSNLPVEPVNFYTKVVSEGDRSVMSVFAFDGNDEFIDQNKHPEMYDGIRSMLTSFLEEFLNTFYQGKINEVEENISDLEDEIADLEKDISDNRDQIEENKKEIENLRDDNNDMEKEIEDKEVRLQKIREKLIKKQNDLDNVNSKLRKQTSVSQ